jgi:hypothetical protein
MKLVIQTQIRENYGAHDWNGEGECPQYWKFKGGNTYVVRDLKESHVVKINMSGIPTLSCLIEDSNEYAEEYILGYDVVEDDAVECEEWETPIEFVWGSDRWLAIRETRPDEYDSWANGITLKSESWIPLKGGERAHYECHYYDSNNQLVEAA